MIEVSIPAEPTNSAQRTSFASHVATTTLTSFLISGLGLVTGALAARLLGSSGRGDLAAIQTWPVFISTVAMLGLPDALVYFVARDRNKAGRYLASSLLVIFVLSWLFVLAGYFAMPLLLASQSASVVTAARWYLLLIPLSSLVAFPFNVLRGLNKLALWNLFRVAPTFIWIIVLVVIYLLDLADPALITSVYLVALIVLVIPNVYFIARSVAAPFFPSLSITKAMLNYGFPAMLASLPQWLNLRLDQMLMAGLLDSRSLGLYVVGAAISNISGPLLNSLGLVLFSSLAATASRAQQAHDLARTGRTTVLLAFFVTLLLCLIIPFALPFVFGAEFSAAVPAALLLAVASAVYGVNITLEGGLRGLGQVRAIMAAELIGFVVTLAGLYFLLPTLGIVGAAITSLIAYSAITVCLVVQVTRLTACSPAALLLPTRSDLSFLLAQLRRFIPTARRRGPRPPQGPSSLGD